MTERIISIRSAPASASPLDETVWNEAASLEQFIEMPIRNAELWRTTTRLARLSPDAGSRAHALSAPARLLVLLEDWCGDAMYTVPFAARIVEANPLLSMRVLPRDQHDALMESHLSGSARSIPVIMTFDAAGRERAWWGPRPSPLQEWMLRDGLAMEKPERYKGVRTWYARDRGATTAHELLTMLERVQDAGDADTIDQRADQRSATANPA